MQKPQVKILYFILKKRNKFTFFQIQAKRRMYNSNKELFNGIKLDIETTYGCS